jgi:hypothetical protein
MPILACKRVRYGSQGDEAAFFGWIERISCVTKFDGSGDTLYLHVPRNRYRTTTSGSCSRFSLATVCQ